MIDCLLIGHNAQRIEDVAAEMQNAGAGNPASRDFDLSFVNYRGVPHSCLDLLNRLRFEDGLQETTRLHSFDFLAPVITYLSTYLHRRGFTVDYVNLFRDQKEQLQRKLLDHSYRAVAITTTFYTYPDPVIEIVRFVRRCRPDVPIVVGGPHIMYRLKLLTAEAAQYFLRQIGADYYVISAEGESSFARLMAALREDACPDSIPNLAYRECGRYHFTPTSPENNSLEGEMVNYRLFPPEDLGEFVSLRTSKSCPFACSFCDFPEIAGKFVYMRPEMVEQELNALREIGTVTTLTFLDDTFNVPKQRFRELMRMMIRNDYPFRWNCFFRVDHADAETIQLMAKAGCEGVFMGVESGSDEVLQSMNKGTRRADYLRAIPWLKNEGIVTYASLIVGFPGETAATLDQTAALIEATRPDFFLPNIWYGHPITPIFRQRQELEIRGSAYNWSHKTMDSETAAAAIERMFNSISGSLWLPFELWSVFYLQRRGMSLARIKEFVRGFNTLVREKAAGISVSAECSPGLDALRIASRFERRGRAA